MRISDARRIIKELYEKHIGEEKFEDSYEDDKWFVVVQYYNNNFIATIQSEGKNENMRWGFKYDGDLNAGCNDKYLKNTMGERI